MHRRFVVVLAILILLAVVWVARMHWINTSATTVTVHVAGTVDRVEIVRNDRPDTPVAIIQTDGKDVTQVVELPRASWYSPFVQAPPAQYSFVAIVGDSRYLGGRNICCETGLGPKQVTLDIRSLTEWSVSGAP